MLANSNAGLCGMNNENALIYVLLNIQKILMETQNVH